MRARPPLGHPWLGLVLLGAAACARPTPSTTTPPAPWVARAEATARTETLTPEDVAAISSVRDVALAPGGRHVAFVRSVPAPLPDKGRAHSEIWIVPTHGRTPPRRLSNPAFSSYAPVFSPDGATLTFRSRRPGDDHAQVYALPVEGGEAVRWTETEATVRTHAFLPDGSGLVYVAPVPTARAKEAEASGRDAIVDEAGGHRGRLYLLPLEDGAPEAGAQPREIAKGELHVIDVRVFPSGRRLLLRAAKKATIDHEMMYSGLYTVPVEGGEPAPLVATEGKLGDLAVSPDGKTVAFLGAHDLHDSTSGIVYVVDADGSNKRALAPDEPMTASRLFFRDPTHLVVLAIRGTRTQFYDVDVRRGTLRPLLPNAPVCSDADLTRTVVACAGSTALHPREVFVGRLPDRGMRRLTVSNEHLANKRLGAQKVFSWQAADGLRLEGILTLPVGYRAGTRYPLAVLPHGGPEGVSLDGWRTRATYPVQILATAGYVVFEPNYRGSAGRGHAFAAADHRDLGGKEFMDVLDGIDALAAEGLIDPSRVGMAGWSYGGYFSALAATMHSERFRAAMIGAAVTDWVSFTGTTEIEHENSLVHWNLWPWDDLDLAWSRSPIRHIDKAKTAVLVVHGLADTRVPPGQGIEIYRALRHKKVPAQLVLYPREPHGLVENVHSVDFMERLSAWFDRHVKDAAPEDAG